MTCRDMDDLMSSGPENAILRPEAVKHLVSCPNCRRLKHVLDESRETSGPSESQLKRIRAGIVDNLQPVRPLAPSRFFLFACAIIFLCVVAVGAMPFGINGWEALNTAQRIAIFVTLIGSAVLLASSLVRQMVPGSKYAFAPSALPIGILSVLMLIIAISFRSQEESAFVANGLACIRNGLTYSIPAAFLFWLILRRGAILFPKLIGAAAGGLAGLVGLTVLELNCPNLNVFHILFWHWGVVLISSLAGAFLGAAVEHIGRWRIRNIS